VASLVPGVLEAYYGCSPVVMICSSASQATEGMGEFQECDQVGLMRPITKWSARVPRTDRITWFVRRAFSIAMNDQPGPVFLEVPNDVGGDITHGERLDVALPRYCPAKRMRTAGDPDLVAQAVEMLESARRPVALAGNGAVLSGASNEFRQFVELLEMPFLTTPGGRGVLSEDHPLALGLSGMYRTRVGKQVYAESDLVVAIGTRNESFQTHRWRDFPAGARMIAIDISGREMGRNWIPDVAIVGDVRTVLRQLNALLQPRLSGGERLEHRQPVRELMEAKKQFVAEVSAECATEAIPIPAKRVVYEVAEAFGDNTVLVNENGSQDCWSYFWPYYRLRGGSECVPVAEQTCMGMGVVGAIAAKLARPEKNVVCVTGDGAFQMYMKELPTAAQYRVGCTWIVLNNEAFGWPKHNQMHTVGWNTTSFAVQPDFVRWAEACRCFGQRVSTPSRIRPALEAALRANREGVPAVLDFPTGIDMSHFEAAR
jgi:acetolactate synthase-1/2/3 large subunit